MHDFRNGLFNSSQTAPLAAGSDVDLRISRAIFGFKSFWSARIIIAGIETMHMIRKWQMDCPEGKTMSAANQFYSLAACSPTQRRNSFR
jgi:hypothetical protein